MYAHIYTSVWHVLSYKLRLLLIMLFIALCQLSGMKGKHISLPPNTLRKKTLSLQLWHYFSPLLLCDGSPGLASLSQKSAILPPS